MFERTLDSEQAFGHHRAMTRTRVRRRRRIAAALLCIALALHRERAGGRGARPSRGSAQGGRAPRPASEQVYVVRAGDTLWSIAERMAGRRDPRLLVDAIAARNGIDAGALVPGQSLIIPRIA